MWDSSPQIQDQLQEWGLKAEQEADCRDDLYAALVLKEIWDQF